VDRVETQWAVIEWWGSTNTADISLEHFPDEPSEGSVWLAHLQPALNGETFSLPTNGPKDRLYQLRLSRLTNNPTELQEHP
jgi:hypothetical protein